MASRSQINIPINYNVQREIRYNVTRLWPSEKYWDFCLFCCLGRIPRLPLIQHSLYDGVTKKSLLPHHSHGSSTERWSRNSLRVVIARVFDDLNGYLTSPLFLIIQWRRRCHLTWSSTHAVMSREIYLWKSFDLLLGSNL